jgi:hypothetical protein
MRAALIHSQVRTTSTFFHETKKCRSITRGELSHSFLPISSIGVDLMILIQNRFAGEKSSTPLRLQQLS